MMETFNAVIQKRLREMQDPKYGDFQAALIPGLNRDRIIGVRTPQLRALAKELAKAAGLNTAGCSAPGSGDSAANASVVGASTQLAAFLRTLPHEYFDEMQLHAFIISEIRDFDTCMSEVERFLPFVDNWATCDQLSPKVFGKKKGGRLVHGAALLEHVDRWLESDHTYTVRFGMGVLMQHFLGDDFDPEYMERIAAVRSDEYYINMMIAWYFATALAMRYDDAVGVLTGNKLDVWTHNKAIQKAVESRRISDETKGYLRTLKRK